MEIKGLFHKFAQWIIKNKIVVLLVALGVVLMVLPTSNSTTHSSATTVPKEDCSYNDHLESRLEEVLSKIEGAGRVEVILTIAKGEEIFYQTDNSLTMGGDSTKEDINTVIITNEN